MEKILDSCRHLFGGEELAVLPINEQGLLQVAAYPGNSEKELLEPVPASSPGAIPKRRSVTRSRSSRPRTTS